MNRMRLHIIFLALFILLLNFKSANAYTITSSSSGGYWNDTLTWVGWMVPGPGDDVIINGPVFVDGTNFCHDLTINPGASLANAPYNYHLFVSGDVVNNGSVGDAYGWLFYIYISGDIQQNGIWSPYYTTLDGAGDQTLSTAPGTDFASSNFVLGDALGTIYAGSDLRFRNATVNFGWEDLLMGNYDIQFINSYIYYINLYANGNRVSLSQNSRFTFANIMQANLGGIVQVEGGVYFYGPTVLSDTLQNWSYNYTAYLYGDITNNGLIRNAYGWLLDLEIAGDIVNNGVWTNYAVRLIDTMDQHLSQAPGMDFAMSYLTFTDTLKDIIAISDIGFVNTIINMNTDRLILQPGSDLSIDGAYVANGRILANGNTITGANAVYLSQMEINNSKLAGTIDVQSGVVFEDSLVVNGVLQNDSYSYLTTVDGVLVNNGTIQSAYGWPLDVDVSGDIHHNGILNFQNLRLTGANPQTVSMAPSSFMQLYQLVDNNPARDIYAGSSLRFSTSGGIYLNGGEWILPTGGNYFSITGGQLDGGRLTANGNNLNMSGNAILSNMTVENAVLDSVIRIYDNNNRFEGQTVLEGILRCAGYTYAATVAGTLINNGAITDEAGWSFSLNLEGDIVHNGSWNNYAVTLTGTSHQHISLSPSSSFNCAYWTRTANTGNLIADTDLRFVGTWINLGNDTLVLAGLSDFSLTGGGYLYNGRVFANNNSVHLHDGAYLQDLAIDQVILKGIVKIQGNNVRFHSQLTVEDTLECNNYDYRALVYGNITNNGLIRDYGGWAFRMDVYGNIINNGLWDSYELRLTGSGDQYISQTPGTAFSPDYVTVTDTNGQIIANTGLSFDNCHINLSGAKLILNGKLDLKGHYLYNGTVEANGNEIHSSLGTYLQDLQLYETILGGITRIYGNNNRMYGQTTVKDTLQSHEFNFQLFVEGNLLNEGLIRNPPSGWVFYLSVRGNITNQGSWNNYRTYLDGTADQYVILVDHKPIQALSTLYSQLGGTAHYWLRDGFPIPGSNTVNLDLNPVNSGSYGTYHCVSTEGPSRRIFIEPGPGCDNKDGFEPNDIQAAAANLYGGAISGFQNMTICYRGDEDWFYVDNNIPGQTLRVWLKGLPRNYDVEVYGSGGLAGSGLNTGTQDEAVMLAGLAKGRYWIRVFGVDGAWSPLPYQLTTSFAKSPAGFVGVKPPVQAQIFKESEAERTIQVYPNPASEFVNIEWYQKTEEMLSVEILSIAGQQLFVRDIGSHSGLNMSRIETTSLSEGIYLLRLSGTNSVHTQRLIIRRP